MTPRKASVVGALLVALGPVSMALYTPAMPTLVHVFDTDVSTIKFTLTIYFFGFAFAQLVCGPMSDAWGRRRIVLGYTVLYLIGSVMALFAPDIGWLLAARLIQGVGAAAGVAISRAIVRDLFTGHQSVQVMNMIGLMLAIGPAVSPTIGGLALDFVGWQSIFAIMVVYGITVIIVFAWFVPETLATPDPRGAHPARLFANYVSLLGDPRFLRPALAMATSIGSIYALATILPFVLIDEAGMTPTAFGVGMLAQSGSFMAGSLAMRFLMNTRDPAGLAAFGMVSMLCGGVALVVLGLTVEPQFLSVMCPVGLITFGVAFFMPSMMTGALAPFPHMAGAASAMSGFAQMGAGLLGSGLAALMGDPVLALTTIIPAMVAIALAAHVAFKGAAIRREAAEAEGARRRAPAE